MDNSPRIFSEIHTFSQSEFDKFAALSGDDNPIHVDPDFAAGSRFGRTVAHGMLLYSRLSGVLGRAFPGWVQQEVELMFPTPTFTGVEVQFRLDPAEAAGEVPFWVEVSVGSKDGEPGLHGRALLGQTRTAAASPEAAGEEAPSAENFKDLALGQRAERSRIFNESNLAGYRELTGDIGRADAGTIPGGLLGGMISDLLGTELPGRGTNWLKQSFSFIGSARPGEPVTAAVEITRVRPEKNLVDLRSTCTGRGGLICEGRTLVWVGDLITISK